MTGKTHLSLGLAVTVAASKYVKFDILLSSLVVCGVASLFPDIDHPKSLINKYILPIKNKSVKSFLYITIGVFLMILNIFYFNLVILTSASLFIMLIGVSTHREGFIHSLSGLIAFSIIFGYISVYFNYGEWGVPFFVGYLSHIISDMFTNRGVPIFYPFIKKKFKMPFTFAVGSGIGNVLEGIIMAGSLIYLTWQVPYLLMAAK